MGRRVSGALGLACLLVSLITPARASIVSRLGDVYFYDPLSFDAGVLQRGLGVRGGADTRGGELETWLDLPFYREFSLRTAYAQRLLLDQDDGHDVSWRLRMPVLESARFGRISSAQAVYAGSASLGASPDRLLPNHMVGAAHSFGRTGRGVAHSLHGQLLFAVRDKDKVLIPDGLDRAPFARVGLTLRVAHLVQLYEPPAGPGGKWTVTLSTVEAVATHFGGAPSQGGAGRLDLVAAAPAINFTPRYATYTLGLIPRLRVEWGPEGPSVDVGGLANLSISYRTQLE